MSRRRLPTGSKAEFRIIPRGTIEVKGAGLMETFFLEELD